MQQKGVAESLYYRVSECTDSSARSDSLERNVFAFDKFRYLPIEIRSQIWKESFPQNLMHFVKLVRLKQNGSYHSSDWRGEPKFFKPTFSGRCTPWEEMLDIVRPLIRQPESWWYTRRPPRVPADPTASIRNSCKEVRRILGGKFVILDVIADNLEHRSKADNYSIPTSEFSKMQSFPLYINPGSDILCIQAGNVEKKFSPKEIISISTKFPGISRITKIAIEFHGPTTREWCGCYDDRDRRYADSPEAVHDPSQCHQGPARTCGKECEGCESCNTYYGGFDNIYGLCHLLTEFPAVDILYLIDWGYERADTKGATLCCSDGDHDFFKVQGEEGWNAERQCPFESLDCAKRIETAFCIYLEFKIRELTNDLKAHENDGEMPDLERELDLVEKRKQKPLSCQVLAAIQRPDGRKG